MEIIPSPSPTGSPPPPPPHLQKRAMANVLGPLTTTWTQPSECSYLLQPRPTLTEFFRNQACILPTPDALNPNATGVPEDIPSCWPPTTSDAPVPTHPFFGWGIYSPAYVCPPGYVTACSAEYGRRSRGGGWSTARMQFDIEPGETVLGCCPESYTCADYSGIGTCTLAVPSTLVGSDRVTVPTAVCEGTGMVASRVMATFPDAVGASEVVAVTRQVTLYAPLFQLYFQETDLPDGNGLGKLDFSAGSSGAGSSVDVPTQSADSNSGVPDKEKGTGGGGGGLSTGATAGIAAGVVIAVVLLLGLGFYLIMRRKKRKREAAGQYGNGLWTNKIELPGQGVAEADSHGHQHNLYRVVLPPAELAANGEGVTPVEMYVPGMEGKGQAAVSVADGKHIHGVSRYS